MFELFDLCCVMRVVLDPEIVLVDAESDEVTMSLQVSKWLSFLSYANKDGLSMRLSLEVTDTITGRVSDGTEMRVSMDECEETPESMDALFASNGAIQMGWGFETVSDAQRHFGSFSEFRYVKMDLEDSNLIIQGVEHSKSFLECKRVVPVKAPVKGERHNSDEMFHVGYLNKLLSAPTGVRCLMRITESSMTNENVLMLRYTVFGETKTAKRKSTESSKPQTKGFIVTCILSKASE
jgi:hypothetical protein